ncbi:Glycine/sarcosine/betaine reductase complex component A1 [bioreactor metagenome]|uniref:Glycine/sarcosine/betaine reductase complex component A1 n=1 Tax=bioreactor metagenome TaxID=1076179 RepID=A0A644ZA28_9ZZZZ
MDLQNQARIKEITEEIGGENIVVLLGAAEPDSASIAAETVTMGDPTYAGALAGVPLGLKVYHITESEIKEEIDPAVYEEQVAMMEMVLNIEGLASEVSKMRQEGSTF